MAVFPRRTVTALVTALVLGPISGAAQRRPDFSGVWVLVEALAGGPGRSAPDGASSEGPRRTSSTTISGAPFNCGRECTISQKGQTLTIEDAQLADYPGKDRTQPTPAVTLHLDGRQAEVVDSFSPPRQLPVTARWEGNKVRIESGGAASRSVAWTQVLSLDSGQLVVVSSTNINGESRGETTFKYRQKRKK